MKYKVLYGIFVCSIASNVVSSQYFPTKRRLEPFSLSKETRLIDHDHYRTSKDEKYLFGFDHLVPVNRLSGATFSFQEGKPSPYKPYSYFSYQASGTVFYCEAEPLWYYKLCPTQKGLLQKPSTPEELYQEQRRRDEERGNISGATEWISLKELQACDHGEYEAMKNIEVLLASIEKLRELGKIK